MIGHSPSFYRVCRELQGRKSRFRTRSILLESTDSPFPPAIGMNVKRKTFEG